MSCPSCNGDDRLEIAPNNYRCTSLRAVPGIAMDLTRLETRILEEPSWVRCGHEYTEVTEGSGAGASRCSCGTFAIGVCVECGDPDCGPHSKMRSDRQLCLKDVRHCETVSSRKDARSTQSS